MCTNSLLTNLVDEVERQHKLKRDYLVSADNAYAFVDGAGKINLAIRNGSNIEAYDVNETCHKLLSAKLQIPWAYYERLLTDHQTLLTQNLNTMIKTTSQAYMVRTIGPTARAWLSTSFKRYDHNRLLENIMPSLENKDLTILTAKLTDTTMVLRFISKKTRAAISVGDIVAGGQVLVNSETSASSLFSAALIYRLKCKNGAIGCSTEMVSRIIHRGAVRLPYGGCQILDKDEYIQGEETYWNSIRATVDRVCDENLFNTDVQKMRAIKELEIQTDPFETVEALGTKYNITKDIQANILHSYLKERDFTGFGLMNALTYVAHSSAVKDINKQVFLEKAGYQFMDWAYNYTKHQPGNVLSLPKAA